MNEKLKALVLAVVLVALGILGYVQFTPGSLLIGVQKIRSVDLPETGTPVLETMAPCPPARACEPCAPPPPCRPAEKCPTVEQCPKCATTCALDVAHEGRTTKHALKLAAAKKTRVVVSMTTTPCKMWSNQLRSVVIMMKEQTYPPDAIYVNIAETGSRDKLEYILPPWLKDDRDVIVLRTKEDYGPIMKLLPTLVQERDPSTRIITVDDDWNYPANMIEHMLEWSLELPDAAVTYTNGWNATCILDKYSCNPQKHGRYRYYVMTQQPSDYACTSNWRWLYGMDMCAGMANTSVAAVHIIQGVGGCMYKRDQFGHEIWDMEQPVFKRSCRFVDDVWISGMLAKRGVVRLVLPQFLSPDDLVLPAIKEHRVKKWNTNTAASVHSEEAIPLDKGKCAPDLHADFLHHNVECANHFSDYFEEDSRRSPLFHEAPNFVVDGRGGAGQVATTQGVV